MLLTSLQPKQSLNTKSQRLDFQEKTLRTKSRHINSMINQGIKLTKRID
jgi:hypothetical protein